MSKKRILVMDDEEILREVIGQILEQMGYEVELSRDGVEAIELYKKAMESHQPFEVVIMDLTIPGGMGGKETLRRLLEINPQVKAIVSSGYSNDPIMADYKQYGFSGVISKPYKIEELSQTLRKVILDPDK
jgi:CheY-like chemotaxis protein